MDLPLPGKPRRRTMTLQPWARSCPGPGGREPRLLELLKLLELVLLEEADGLAMW